MLVDVYEILHHGRQISGPKGILIPPDCFEPEALVMDAMVDFAATLGVDPAELTTRKRHDQKQWGG